MTAFPQGVAANTISLLLGHPDPTTLATPEFQEKIRQLASQPDLYKMLQYGPEQGTPALINFLVEKLNRDERLAVTSENVMIVAGSTHAVDMIARLYGKPDGVVLVEAPSYADAIHIFRDHRLELQSIPMDENGLLVSELKKTLEGLAARGKSVSLLYTIPDFHNPTGVTLSHERRVEIVQLARQYGFWIVEDNVYRDLGFGQTPPPTFYALAEGQQVFQIGSFSKTLAPGLRVGWLTSSTAAIQTCVEAGTTQMGGGANPFTARIIADYCCDGHWEQHVTHLRALYQKRCDIAIAALERFMPQGVRWTHPVGGYFLWLTLPASIFARDVKQMALKEGVLLASGGGYFINPSDGEHNLRIAFSFAALDDIPVAIQRLAAVIARA